MNLKLKSSKQDKYDSSDDSNGEDLSFVEEDRNNKMQGRVKFIDMKEKHINYILNTKVATSDIKIDYK